jgi:hypothetical protein
VEEAAVTHVWRSSFVVGARLGEAAAAILCVVLARSGLVSSRNPKNRVKTELAARYFPNVRQIAWIGKSLPISRIRVSCSNGKLMNCLE